jgi:predicted CoA-substrate-specific enzyme activase
VEKLQLGIDVGSLTIKVVLLDGQEVRAWRYLPSQGVPLRGVLSALDELFSDVSPGKIKTTSVTGSGGMLIGELLSARYVNELVAQTRAVERFCPEARSVIEIGGQDSKFLVLEKRDGRLVLVDFALNTQCAAGTGSFLEQQATRLGTTIEEFSDLATQAEDAPYIAGRCAVFAKSDIVHLQQVGTPFPEILKGLCLALARNFCSDIARGKPFCHPILFQGGVSKNQGMVSAFETVLGLKPGELIIPEHQVLMPAIGAALTAEDQDGFQWKAARERLLRAASQEVKVNRHSNRLEARKPSPVQEPLPVLNGRTPGFLGIDVGSISTKAVAIDTEGRLLSKVYRWTRADPLGATNECLRVLQEQVGKRLDVCGVGVTGSGRDLVGWYVGADVVKNEITAQYRAATAIDPDVDTVFEIGGQDSKYIRVEDGIVVDFSLNKACAAGTGSFLEEQASRLGITVGELVEAAFSSPRPVQLGERCTVFMESDLIHHQQRGAAKADLAAGLAYSIAINYLNRVVGDKPIGNQILFQGGVAGNHAVTSAFENILEKSVTVPPHFEVTGALGAALIAQEVLG